MLTHADSVALRYVHGNRPPVREAPPTAAETLTALDLLKGKAGTKYNSECKSHGHAVSILIAYKAIRACCGRRRPSCVLWQEMTIVRALYAVYS